MKSAGIVLAALIVSGPVIAEEVSEEQAAAKRLLVAAYIEGEAFCADFPSGTYVTHIGGIRVDADCKIRQRYVQWLAARGETLVDVEQELRR